MSYGIASGELFELEDTEPNPNGELVIYDGGGWNSGPGLTPEQLKADEDDYANGGPREYDRNIVALMADYTDFVVIGGSSGYKAYLRGERSRAVGSAVTGLTLDELAHEMSRIRRRLDGA